MKAAAAVGKTVTIYKDRFIYPLGPNITMLDNGEWLAGFNHSRRRERMSHPPGDPMYRNLLTRSSDLGATWGEPYIAPGFEWAGVEHPGLLQLRNGTVILTQYRFAWYPLGLARKRKAAGEPIAINLPNGDRGSWTEDFTDDDWARSTLSYARGCCGLYAHLSTDGGYTFEDTIKIDCSPYRDGFTRNAVVELADGRVAYVVTEHHPPFYPQPKGDTYILFSSTGGRSWDPPILVNDSPVYTFGEPSLAEIVPGELYCVLRITRPEGFLHACRSFDGGESWSALEATPMYALHNPGHLLVLRDGRLLCTYGRRTAPFGIRACLSDDGGRNWEIDREIVIRSDMPNEDLGYPMSIEYEPGRLFSCYYSQEPDGLTCIQGTYVTLL